jgi:oligosaccharide reducing-end xylanase
MRRGSSRQRSRAGFSLGLLAGALALAACRTTVDTLGSDARLGGAGAGSGGGAGGAESGLHPITGPASYPNAFKDLLGKTDAEIENKIEAAFQRLFYGDPDTEAIYFPIGGGEQAAIRDTFHNDVRTEGIGLGMIITVERAKHDEFDRLWSFAKASLLIKQNGAPAKGYFNSTCDMMNGKAACLDPYGHQQFITALLFARDRWGNAGAHDYEADAQALLEVMRNKEQENGGVVDGVTNMFDEQSKLVFDLPNQSVGQTGRPSIAMPAYYELWAQATRDDFYKQAASAAREYWKASVNVETGLIPVRSHFDGSALNGWNFFGPEAYRAQLNMTLDHIWFGTEPWEGQEADKLLAFFASQGLDRYAQSYTLDGSNCTVCGRDSALIAMNGVSALISSHAQRIAFIQAVWDQDPAPGPARYFAGLMHLLALLTLSGQYRVY